MNQQELNDYGFTAHTLTEITADGNNEIIADLNERIRILEETNSGLKSKIVGLRDIINPLLNNLYSAEGDFIKWPEKNRRKIISEQLEKVEKIADAWVI